ncbi:MAG: adenylate/guanylate cyclase domain-containing protein, partial [Myxococcota bacterium]|nr:adenylate/guanylate cyclase domain-containing protein [Myxococcota bacterium]
MSEATLKKKDRSKNEEKTPLELMATFVAPPILRRYNDDPTKPDGPQERRHTGAVLFLDISGFTKMTEALAEKGAEGTEQITRILNHHFDTLVGIVESFSGEVVKYAGDAFAAIWICPIAGKDIRQVVHRASTCALKMQYARKSLEKKHKTKLQFKIGIGCGALKLTHVGGVNDKWDLLVKGAALEQAVFAEGCAVPGDTVVSHKAWECVAPVASGKEHASGNYFLKGLKKQAKARAVKDRQIKPEAESSIRLYVPASVTSRIDAGQGAYIGELRQATIMFCNLPDIRSRASVDKDQRIIEQVQQVIFKYEGAINKLSIDDKGVSVLAVWGLPPLVHENDPERAVRAALGIQEVFGPKKVRCSIGVTTGQAFSGAIGGETRKEYTVIGDVVNLSARLMQNAKGGILTDIATFNAAQQKVQFKALSEITVKGKSKPIKIFRPVGAGGASVKITANKKFIVGRKKERSILSSELKGLELDTPSRVLVIQGEPGTGKSHLVHHTMQLAKEAGLKSFIGEASSIETSTPYLAWRGLFIQLLGFNERGRRQSPKDLVLKMLSTNPEYEKRAPVLNEVLNIRIPENDYSRRLGGKVRAERAQELLIHLLQILTQEERYIFVLEDAHWFDTASWELLMALVQNVSGVIVLLTTRAMPLPPPTWYVQLLKRNSTQMMRIGNLSKEEAAQLVAFKLGVKEIPEALQVMVYDHSQGNPFFTHELAMTLEDEGMVIIDDGECQLPPNFGAKGHLEVPNTIEGVVGSRIDALSPPQQLALKVASVIGRSFEFKLLAAVYPVAQDREDLGRHLDSLRARGFVDQDKVGKSKLFIFHHVITQEVSYKLMLFDQRRAIHREIALWMEDLKKGQSKGYFGLLAHHWSHTDNVKKAYGYLDKAGELARRAGAYHESAEFFGRALELSENPDLDEANQADESKRAGWQRKLSDSYFAMGRGKESAEFAGKALETLGQPQPTNERGWKILLFKGALRQLFHQLMPRALIVAKDDQLRQHYAEFSYASRRLAELFYYEHADLQMMGTSLLSLNMAERVGNFPGTCFAYSMFAVVLGARG